MPFLNSPKYFTSEGLKWDKLEVMHMAKDVIKNLLLAISMIKTEWWKFCDWIIIWN